MNESVTDLIAALDSADAGEAEEAQALLKAKGQREDVLLALIAAIPGFGASGQLCGIEVFISIGDSRAGGTLVKMFRSEDETVREWAANAVSELQVRGAVPELRHAYEQVKQRGTPLDWTEPEAIRNALTALGARPIVLPSRVATLAREEGQFSRCWDAGDLHEVLRELVNADQLILCFQYWAPWRDTYTWKSAPGWDLPWDLPWSELVSASGAAALHSARLAEPATGVLATVSWMDQSDR
jgi:hypothetical protein